MLDRTAFGEAILSQPQVLLVAVLLLSPVRLFCDQPHGL